MAQYTFEWDEEKDLINQKKHGISFKTAAYVFCDKYYIEMYDFEHSINEDRYIAIGKVGDLLFVVFTERGENIRLISARLATESERRLYYDQDFYH
ncbi:MAG: BrnT family toxin [Clostridium sp.]|nr:BrnT family toxin [Clostridium sp.]